MFRGAVGGISAVAMHIDVGDSGSMYGMIGAFGAYGSCMRGCRRKVAITVYDKEFRLDDKKPRDKRMRLGRWLPTPILIRRNRFMAHSWRIHRLSQPQKSQPQQKSASGAVLTLKFCRQNILKQGNNSYLHFRHARLHATPDILYFEHFLYLYYMNFSPETIK